MSDKVENLKSSVRKEALLFLWMLLAGLFILPLIVYLVGRVIFGEYGGTGFSAFYAMLHSELRAGEPGVWFLVLSPYLIWQLLRLTLRVFRATGQR